MLPLISVYEILPRSIFFHIGFDMLPRLLPPECFGFYFQIHQQFRLIRIALKFLPYGELDLFASSFLIIQKL